MPTGAGRRRFPGCLGLASAENVHSVPARCARPADAEVPSHKLLVRAGLVRRVALACLVVALGYLVYRNVERIVREEMDAAGFQEVHFRRCCRASPTRRPGAGPSTARR